MKIMPLSLEAKPGQDEQRLTERSKRVIKSFTRFNLLPGLFLHHAAAQPEPQAQRKRSTNSMVITVEIMGSAQ